MGIGSAGPAYSMAAATPALLAAAGTHSAGVILAASIPVVALAVAYARLNREHPDCGTSFAWISRAFGPTLGWMSGWASLAVDILVMASLGDVAGWATLDLVGAEAPRLVQVLIGACWLVAVAWVALRGIRPAALLQRFLVPLEIAFLVVLGSLLFVNAFGGGSPDAGWLSPLGTGHVDLPEAAAVAVFLFWGWETSLCLNEEMRERRRAPGRAGLIAITGLSAVYVVTLLGIVAASSSSGVSADDDVLATLARAAGGVGLATALTAVVLLSAVASAQGTIIPSARLSVSMARAGVLHRRLATADLIRVPPRAATIVVSTAGIGWYVLVAGLGENVLNASLGPLSVLISFYYGLVGLSCVRVVAARREAGPRLLRSRCAAIAAAVVAAAAFAYFLAEAAWSLVSQTEDGGFTVEESGPLLFSVALVGVGATALAWRRRGRRTFVRD
jgi:amino acid transporter